MGHKKVENEKGKIVWNVTPLVVGHCRSSPSVVIGHGRDCDHHTPGDGCCTACHHCHPRARCSEAQTCMGLCTTCATRRNVVTPANMSWVGFGQEAWLRGNGKLWTRS